jgi:hypothetical protein
MSRRVRAGGSTGATRSVDHFVEAREILVQARERLVSQVRDIDGILERLASIQAAPRLNPKKALKELFEARDLTQLGSKEEEQAAEKILEAMFPDTNAG